MAPRKRPEWWGYDLEFTEHVRDQMAERYLTEIGLRELMNRVHHRVLTVVTAYFE